MKLFNFNFKTFAIIGLIILIGYGASPYKLNDNKSGLYRVSIIISKTAGEISGLTVKSNAPIKSSVNDPYFKEQWNIKDTKSNEAWGYINQKKQVLVAVVDTGVDYNHPDLKDRVLKSAGYNFINNSKDTMDDNWHGTHVSGIIAAEASNNIGIAGIVGPLDVKIVPVKVMDQNGHGSSDIVAKGIRYAADIGADVINLSVNFDSKDEYIESAIDYARKKNVFVVVSAGNENTNCDTSSPTGDYGAFTVAAVDRNNNRTVFSNYGNVVKVAAPGVSIISTIPGGKYEFKDGTSMASPIVAGIAAMLKAEYPSLKPIEIDKILENSTQDIASSGKDIYSGYGIVDAKEAVLQLKNIEK